MRASAFWVVGAGAGPDADTALNGPCLISVCDCVGHAVMAI
jgi:hypothetical protein